MHLNRQVDSLYRKGMRDNLTAITKQVERFTALLPDTSTVNLWNELTAHLHGPATNGLVAAGRDVAARLDSGEGAGLANGYHHLTHFKEVLYGAAVLSRVATAQGTPLSAREEAVLLFSALAHDYNHDGGKNGDVPLRLETASFNGVAGDLKRHGVDTQAIEMIDLMIASTDVSKTPDYVNKLLNGSTATPPAGYEKLAALGRPEHARTAELAAMLRDADILMSSGISGAASLHRSQQLGREWGQQLDYNAHLGFIKFVVSHPDEAGERHAGYSSQAGKFFTPNIERVKSELEKTAAAPAAKSPAPPANPS